MTRYSQINAITLFLRQNRYTNIHFDISAICVVVWVSVDIKGSVSTDIGDLELLTLVIEPIFLNLTISSISPDSL